MSSITTSWILNKGMHFRASGTILLILVSVGAVPDVSGIYFVSLGCWQEKFEGDI